MSLNRKILALLFVAATLAWGILLWRDDLPITLPSSKFIAQPYLQLGRQGSLSLLWQYSDEPGQWKLEVKQDGAWVAAPPVAMRRMLIDSIPPYRLYEVDLTAFGGKAFDYRLLLNDQLKFAATANERMQSDSKYRFVVFGDGGDGSSAQKKIAYQIYKAKPSFIVVVGDIVYPCGRAREYIDHLFPIYNNEIASPSTGAPLMRSTLFVAVPGNHDIGKSAFWVTRDFGHFPDSLAYFYEWSQPLNGPGKKNGDPNTPLLLGNPARQDRFRAVAGTNYPTMANFFFDLGDARFVALDGNDYMNWSNPQWRKWLDETLAAAKDKKWRFVFVHETPFDSDTHHFSEQQMRLICDILQKNNVRIAFAGHVHNYQRTYPLNFAAAQPTALGDGSVPGQFTISKTTNGGPEQITYITTGAGGAELTGANMAATPSSWQNFTEKFVGNTHSFTVCDVDGDKLSAKQVNEDGTVLDQFTISATPFVLGPVKITLPTNQGAK